MNKSDKEIILIALQSYRCDLLQLLRKYRPDAEAIKTEYLHVDKLWLKFYKEIYGRKLFPDHWEKQKED